MAIFEAKCEYYPQPGERRKGSELTIDTPNASKSLSFRNQSIEDSSNLPSQENRRPSESHLERLFLENDFHSFARELRTGEAPLT